MTLTFRQMQVVHAVATMGTVSAAANVLGVSGPAVSMILRDASDAAGFPLFSRSRGAMRPTEEMKALAASIATVLDGYAGVGKLVEQLANIKTGRMMIASTPTLTGHLLPSALAELGRSHPDVDSFVVTLTGAEVLDAVRKQHCHVGLTIGAEDAQGVTLFNLFKGHVIVVARKDHPVAARDRIELHELSRYPIVSVPQQSPFGRIFSQACQSAGVTLSKHIEVSHASAAIAFARQGLGLAIVDPLSAPEPGDPDVAMVQLFPLIGLTHQLVLPSEERPSRTTLKLVSAIRRVVKTIVGRDELHLVAMPWRAQSGPGKPATE